MTTLVDGGAIPTGAIIAFGGPIGNIPDGFLLCDGALVNRNDFADLFAVISTNWGTTNGTNFRLPTTQGLLLRGRANGSGFDPDRNSRNAIQSGGSGGDAVGSYQSFRVQSHRHITYNWGSGHNVGNNNSYNLFNGYSRGYSGNGAFNSAVSNRMAARLENGGSGFGIAGFNGNANSNSLWGKRVYTANSGSNQTVGNNVYVNYIIKF